MWQAMRPDGRLVQVFAGVQQGRSKLIFIELDVMTGVNEFVLEVPLPDGSGVPRLSGVEGTTLALSTSTGAAFRFDVVRRIMSASN